MNKFTDELVIGLEESLQKSKQGGGSCINDSIPAAILVPFVYHKSEWCLLFTKRTNGVATHQGEISFPGGASEINDQDLVETALRETREEIGITSTSIKVLGVLEPVPTISNFCVLPVIGIVDWPVELRLNHSEVDKILLIPIKWLMDENNWYESDYVYQVTQRRKVIHYTNYENEHLWGLTARIAQNTLDLIKKQAN